MRQNTEPLFDSRDDKEYYIDFSSVDAVCKNRNFEIKHPECVGFSELAIAVCLVLEFAITAIIALITGRNDLIGAYFTEFLPSRDFWLAIASGSIIIAVIYIIITIARKGKML